MLRKVPEYTPINPFFGGFSDNPRLFFFMNQGEYVSTMDGMISNLPFIIYRSLVSNTKYYYRRYGDTLVPVGKFVETRMVPNQTRSNIFRGFLEYQIFFDSGYYTMEDELYYTDEEPAAGSVPPNINDIPLRGGIKLKTKKHKKANKKNRKTIYKKRRFNKNKI